MKGTIRLTNTSPTSDLEEQDEEVIIPNIKPQAGITQADTQEETLQQESLETEDTRIKRSTHQKTKIQDPYKSRIQGT